MLVLYVLTFIKLTIQKKVSEDQLDKINTIQSAVKELPQKYFTYQPDYKRFSLNRQIQFTSGSSEISLEVGRSIESLVSNLKTKYTDEDIKYLIVVEGMSSRDDYSLNDELSYKRALSLARLWEQNNLTFDPKICELQIAGSGAKGIGRFSGGDEFKNQRFLIQIVPKIGNLETR
jgi:outer membrane protein OmpA-like peptidoglycan-associated protein